MDNRHRTEKASDHFKQLWKIEGSGEDRTVTYLSTLQKHTQAVNVVRWCPRGAHYAKGLLCVSFHN